MLSYSQIKVSDDAIDQFSSRLLVALNSFEDKPLVFPLKFDKIDDEINIIATYALLQFGSGYRKELHSLAGMGASDTMVRGLLGAHITGRSLDSAFFLSITPALISDIWYHYSVIGIIFS